MSFTRPYFQMIRTNKRVVIFVCAVMSEKHEIHRNMILMIFPRTILRTLVSSYADNAKVCRALEPPHENCINSLKSIN